MITPVNVLRSLSRHLRVIMCATIAFCTVGHVAQAQTASWIGAGATGGATVARTWSDSANWNSGSVPNAAGATVVFSGTWNQGINNIALLGSATTTVGSITMTNIGTGTTATTGKLNLTATSGTATLRLDTGSATQPVINYTTGGASDNFLNVVLTGSQGYEKTGAGVIQVNNFNNTYTGTTKITGGGVRFARNANLGDPTSAGPIQLNGGTLYLRSDAGSVALDDRAAFANAPGANKRNVSVTSGTSFLNLELLAGGTTVLEITGNLTSSAGTVFRKTGGGTLNLRGSANNMLGTTQLDFGTTNMSGVLSTNAGLSIGVSNSAPTATAPAPVLNWTGSGTVAGGAASLVLNDAGTNTSALLSITSGTLTIGTGSSSSTGGLYVGGKGSGTASVNGGLLSVSANKTVSIGSFLQWGGNNGRGTVDILSGTMRANGAGDFYVGYAQTAASGTFAGAGTVNLNGGVLETSRSIVTGSSSLAVASGTFNFNGGTLRVGGNQSNLMAVTTANVGDGGAVIDTNGFTATIGQALLASGSGGLTKNGAGTLTLSGANTYTGNTQINAGSLAIGSVGALPGYDTAGRFSVASGATLAVANTVSDAEVAQIVGTGNFAGGGSLGFDTSAGNRTFASPVSGDVGLTKLGGNALTLSAANSYSGSTLLAAGTVVVDNADALGSSGAISFAGGTLQYTANNNVDYSSRFSTAAGQTVNVNLNGQSVTWANGLKSGGASSLNRAGTGALALTGSDTSIGTGGFTVNGGTTTINPGAGGGFAVAGRLTVHNATTSGGITALRIESGSNSFSSANGIAGIGDASSGSGSLVIAGGQTTMTLSTNRFLVGNKSTGSLDIVGGSFTINGTPDINVGGDQSFALNNATGSINVASGTLSITGAGNLRLGVNVSGSTTGANGAINLTGGVFETARPITMLTGSGAGTGTVNFNGGTLRALASSTNFIAVTTANVQNGGAVIDTNAFNLTIAQSLQNAGSGGLTKVGLGTLTLSAANAYAGATAVDGGTLKAGNVNAFSSGAVTLGSGATLDLNSLAIANVITNNGGTIINGANYAGTMAITTGTQSVSGVGGTVEVDASAVADFEDDIDATVVVKNGGRGRALGTLKKDVTVSSGGLFEISDSTTIDGNATFSFTNAGQIAVNRGNALTIGKVISGTGSLLKSGTGRLTLTGNNTLSGPTQIQGGELKVNGSLAGSVIVDAGSELGGSGVVGAISGAGLVGPGNSPGILTVLESFDPAAGTDFAVELTGTGAPNWTNETASINDVIRLKAANPFTAPLTTGNQLRIYLDAADMASGNTFLGGFFIDQPVGVVNLASYIADADFLFYVSGGSDVVYNGAGYSTLANYMLANPEISGIDVGTVTVASADFGGGDVVTDGQVMQFVVVPEPGAAALAVTGACISFWLARRRR